MNTATVQNKCRHRTALFDHKHVRFSSELIADSTLSRLTGSARYLELEGPDMRRRNTTLSEEKGWKEVTAGTNE